MRLRAPRRDEADAVLAIIVTRDVADVGRPDQSLQDILDGWELPEVDVERDVFVAVSGLMAPRSCGTPTPVRLSS